jgi:hypothetical protein
MFGFELEGIRGADLVRFTATLGKHRYVASRLHLVHAFVFEAIEAAGGSCPPATADAIAWARRAIGSGAIDLASRDERLYRRASDAELVAALEAFWGEGASPRVRGRLEERLAAIGAPAIADPSVLPFDETREDELFPVLLDVGWELLPLTQLDPERHRGAIQCFDDFEVARFEEESAIPPRVTLHELPSLGSVELLHAFDDGGLLRAPFVLWQEGHEAYLDYVLRGVLRAARLEAGA